MRAPDSRQSIRIILFAAILLVVPVFIVTSKLSFRLDGDYNAHLPLVTYAAKYVREYHVLPTVYPFVTPELPVVGDPISPLLNPLFTVPLVLFGVEIGLRFVIFLIYMLSGLSMWYLLRTLRIAGWPRVFGALLYMTSGALVGRVVAGHLEQLFSYPLIPIVLVPFLSERLRRIDWVIGGFALSLMLLSGDLYRVWFLLIFFVCAVGYRLIAYRDERRSVARYAGMFLFLFFVSSLIKIIPFLRDVYPRMARFGVIDPFEGSIQPPFVLLPFVMPFQVSFYDRPTVQRLLGFHFNWFEYYAFLTPFPFLFLWKIRRIVRERPVRIMLLLLLVGVLYIAIAYLYSPFYWLFTLFPVLRSIRTPMRMIMPMTAILVVLMTRAFVVWFNGGERARRFALYLFILTLAWTSVTSYGTLYQTFAPARTEEAGIADALRERDPAPLSVASFVCCMQPALARAGFTIVDYYYGWRINGGPHYAKEGAYDLTQFAKHRPVYVITRPGSTVFYYGYAPILQTDHYVVWKTRSSNIPPVTKAL